MIGWRIAFVLYAALVVVAFWTLHDTALYVALIIVLGLAAKTGVDLLRRHWEKDQ